MCVPSYFKMKLHHTNTLIQPREGLFWLGPCFAVCVMVTVSERSCSLTDNTFMFALSSLAPLIVHQCRQECPQSSDSDETLSHFHPKCLTSNNRSASVHLSSFTLLPFALMLIIIIIIPRRAEFATFAAVRSGEVGVENKPTALFHSYPVLI